MGNFKIPMFQYLVNSADQAILKASKAGVVSDYGGATNLVPATADHLFRVEKELPWFSVTQLALLAAATRVRKTVYAAPVKQIATWTITAAAGGAKGDSFRLITNSFDLTPTVFQNVPVEKRYQLSVACTDAAAVAANIAAVINADENAPVTAVAAAAVVTLTNKNNNEFTNAYVENTAWSGVFAVTTPASPGVNGYDQLKNIQWNTDLDFDRNAEYYPAVGGQYNSYYFEVNWSQDTGGHSVPGQAATSGKSQFVIYVAAGIALDTALDAFATDMNV